MTRSNRHGVRLKLLTTALIVAGSSGAVADSPGRGLTADFEKKYLRMIIDHH
jgi:hypothetical protein